MKIKILKSKSSVQTELFDKNGMIFYDKYIIAFSGGKDSMACVLHLLEMGVPKDRIELWHHDIDGNGETFMDWEITPAYCRAFAAAFGIAIYFSWKVGGFKGEMLRQNSLTQQIAFEIPNGSVQYVGGKVGKLSTRLKFPQVSADLSVRWCSSYCKVDVCTAAIINQDRFRGLLVCVVSGERGEESKARSQYEALEPDRSDLRKGKKYKRYIDHYRPVKDWTEQQIWNIIEKFRIRVHPCYYLGFGRCSCKFCIFGNANQFASGYAISPVLGNEIIGYEDSFGITIKRNINLRDHIAMGTPYPSITKELSELATSKVYDLQIIFNENEEWLLPAGAFGENCGPI